ncbi:hypothetical protein GQ43DRAFT_446633 [Delitschia confertaspora ATCC 74209]|uniref:DnaJ homologue subfamily C member 28 conserved domain-containing protein n=1 Tax=Delitschia confertaspora ATCC 74209 TaxID=1513339 RepID=A0A9P4JSY3_9PLEO|nr:hypothetical protein GQ43DRAFT_446633 [Delitschia confertaspora ATCC 74209]
MSRRLRNLTEESLEYSGRSGQKAVSEAGFSEELRKRLEERIASANFRNKNRSAFLEAELPSTVGRGTKDLATADPWAGEENLHDANLRMLSDAYKPLRGARTKISGPSIPLPRNVDTGRSKGSAGTRLVNARDRSGLYSSLKDSEYISEQEKEQRFKELKERFSPNARAIVPGTIQGLASLANERIEDAIARGQFKNLPRGQKIERDYNASSPFLDTTEYFLNKIIQKQEIVPPWIEKQQELISTANKFRSRLRNDWRRHATRMIASKGGSLLEQMQRAEAYAQAELIANPLRRPRENDTTVTDPGHASQISISGELDVSSSTVESTAGDSVDVDIQSNSERSPSDTATTQNATTPNPSSPTSVPPAPRPFRDPDWESAESAYLNLSINSLNSLTRSYNLQAPDLAKKPYFSLTRELNACYAEVAPQLAELIRERALAPRARMGAVGGSNGNSRGGIMDGLMAAKVKVRDEKIEKQYGFKQLWKDVFGASK